MARDYVGYLTADYVRGNFTDCMCAATASTFCHHCGETQLISVEGCHIQCYKCGAISEGCGD